MIAIDFFKHLSEGVDGFESVVVCYVGMTLMFLTSHELGCPRNGNLDKVTSARSCFVRRCAQCHEYSGILVANGDMSISQVSGTMYFS